MKSTESIVDDLMRNNFSENMSNEEAAGFLSIYPVAKVAQMMLMAYIVYLTRGLTPYQALREVMLSYADAVSKMVEIHNAN